MRGPQRAWQVLLLAVLAAMAGCSYPVRNQPLATLDPLQGYRAAVLIPSELPDTLVIVAASGGGTRATALTMGTLDAMTHLRLPHGQRSLADEVDIISSVSGGSVAAAYFALEGPAGLPRLEQDFIRQDGIAALLTDGLNPFGLAALATPGKERIDLLIDYLDERLFHEKTYADLKPSRAFLILNAADMVEGAPFALTQDNFDLLCSDLRQLKLSTGVAASAAFPVALSAVTLKNYSPCAAQEEAPVWPPSWTDSANKADDWYRHEYGRVIRQRTARDYALGQDVGKNYIHLLDGGISDNLGIAEPYRMLSTNDTSNMYLNLLNNRIITRIVIVLVNARADSASELDKSDATPGIVDMFSAVVSSGIDNTSYGTINTLRALIDETFASQVVGQPDLRDRVYLLPVDFDAIPDDRRACRENLQSIGTSWTLKPEQIDAVIAAAPALLTGSPDYRRMVADLGLVTDLPDGLMDDACRLAAAARGS